MKKLFVFLLAFVYLASCCEAMVYMHYCMGKQIGLSLYPMQSGRCQRCGMKRSAKGMNCCKDEQKIIKSDKTQKVTDLNYAGDLQKKFTKSFFLFPEYGATPVAAGNYNCHYTNGPPIYDPVPVYLLNNVFRI